MHTNQRSLICIAGVYGGTADSVGSATDLLRHQYRDMCRWYLVKSDVQQSG